MPEQRRAYGVRRWIVLVAAFGPVVGSPATAWAGGVAGVAQLETEVHVDVPYPYVGVPLLSGFHLQFPETRRCSFYAGCSTHRVDKRMRKIQVAPHADCAGRLAVSFRDDSGDDPFRYSVRHLSYGSPSRRTHHASEFCQPEQPCRLPLEPPLLPSSLGEMVFVLVGFSFEFHHEDDEIWKVGVRSDGDAIVVDFGHAADPANHAYQADVDYAWVPRRALGAMDVARGTVEDDTGMALPTGIPAGDLVIRGFHLAFTGRRDRHLNRIGVFAPGAHVPARTITLADKSLDEDFTWEVEWAIFDRALASPDAIYREVPAAANP